MERLHCASSLYIQTENFQFIVDPAEEPPRDYIVTATEDLHQNGIVAEVVLADIFSVGPPFTVTILRGKFIILRGKLTILRGRLSILKSKLTILRSTLTILKGKLTILRGKLTILMGKLTILMGKLTILNGKLTMVNGRLLIGRLTSSQF